VEVSVGVLGGLAGYLPYAPTDEAKILHSILGAGLGVGAGALGGKFLYPNIKDYLGRQAFLREVSRGKLTGGTGVLRTSPIEYTGVTAMKPKGDKLLAPPKLGRKSRKFTGKEGLKAPIKETLKEKSKKATRSLEEAARGKSEQQALIDEWLNNLPQ